MCVVLVVWVCGCVIERVHSNAVFRHHRGGPLSGPSHDTPTPCCLVGAALATPAVRDQSIYREHRKANRKQKEKEQKHLHRTQRKSYQDDEEIMELQAQLQGANDREERKVRPNPCGEVG